jgi:hypothetical protein
MCYRNNTHIVLLQIESTNATSKNLEKTYMCHLPGQLDLSIWHHLPVIRLAWGMLALDPATPDLFPLVPRLPGLRAVGDLRFESHHAHGHCWAWSLGAAHGGERGGSRGAAGQHAAALVGVVPVRACGRASMQATNCFGAIARLTRASIDNYPIALFPHTSCFTSFRHWVI